MPMHAFNRFTAHSVYGLRAARDTAVLELRDHYGWAPGPAFTLAKARRRAARLHRRIFLAIACRPAGPSA
jgi:hypothetical protein